MAKVEILGPKSCFFDVVSLLHDIGTLHIEDLSKQISAGEVPLDRMQPGSDSLAATEQAEDLLIRVRAIMKALVHPGGEVDAEARTRLYERLWALEPAGLSDEVFQVIDEVEERTKTLAAEKTALESELSLLGRYEPVLAKIQPLAKQIVTTGNYESVALLVERRYKGGLDALKQEIDKITHRQCEIVSSDVDEDTTAAIIVFPRTFSEPVRSFLSAENVNQLRLPSDLQDVPFDEAYRTIAQRRKSVPGELDQVREELATMSQRWYMRLSTIRDVLADRLAEVDAIPNFGQTDYTFVMSGWVPLESVKELRHRMAERFGDKIVIDQTEIKEEEYESTPVSMKNAGILKPFESLLSIVGQPKYGTVDPTWMIFLFYPLFFGMIVGDVGYGLLMLGIVVWARLKFKDNDLAQMGTAVLGPAATLAVAFGVLYGEFFGDLGTRILAAFGIHFTPIFDRTQSVVQLIIIVLAVGFVQIVLGLVLGIINGVRTKHIKHVWERSGMLAVLVGVVGLIVFGALASLPLIHGLGPAVALIIQATLALCIFVGAYFAVRGGGVVGGVELISNLANVASYIRIMAVGLAGAMFAVAINQLVDGLGNVVLGSVVGIILHTLNFIIIIFSPNIHALRLNLLEFFNKFYESGGKQYRPFQKTGGEKNV